MESLTFIKRFSISADQFVWRISNTDDRWETVKRQVFQLPLKKQNKVSFSIIEFMKQRYLRDTSLIIIIYDHNNVQDFYLPVGNQTQDAIEDIFRVAGIKQL